MSGDSLDGKVHFRFVVFLFVLFFLVAFVVLVCDQPGCEFCLFIILCCIFFK